MIQMSHTLHYVYVLNIFSTSQNNEVFELYKYFHQALLLSFKTISSINFYSVSVYIVNLLSIICVIELGTLPAMRMYSLKARINRIEYNTR